LICLFDIGGITYAVASVAGLVERQGEKDEHLPGAHGVFAACGLGSVVAAALGCSPVIALGESFAGVIVGGRTGLTAIFNGLFFLLAIPLAPIFSSIPTFASAPVLVLLGVECARRSLRVALDVPLSPRPVHCRLPPTSPPFEFSTRPPGSLLALTKFLDLEDTTKALPSFCTIALMPYLYSIDRAIVAGLLVHIVLQVLIWCSSKLDKLPCWCSASVTHAEPPNEPSQPSQLAASLTAPLTLGSDAMIAPAPGVIDASRSAPPTPYGNPPTPNGTRRISRTHSYEPFLTAASSASSGLVAQSPSQTAIVQPASPNHLTLNT
jgi:hypothetical protein